MTMLVHTTVDNLLALTGVAIMDLFWKIFTVLLIFAIFDRFWGKYQWLRQNKMTKDEVKDERKAVEGDEETKREIKNRGLTRLMQQIMSSVPNADVVVTNPTHYSVALKYDRDTMRAPTILAKGKGFRALRIREVARDAGVPILQRKPLARALFHTGEEGKEIPYELYRAVAELFAYVYKLKNPHAAAMQTAPQG